MYQKLLILKKWEESELVSSRDAKLKDFFSYFMKHPNLGWNDFAKMLRAKYKDLFDTLVPPLLEIDDELVSLNVINRLELKRNIKEREWVQRFITNQKMRHTAPALEAIARMNDSAFDMELRKRTNLPPVVAAILLERAQQKGSPRIKPRP